MSSLKFLVLFIFIIFVLIKKISSLNDAEINDDVITVCGINQTYSECTCEEKNLLSCGVTYPLRSNNIIYTNIKVLNETFIVKSLSFWSNPIKILRAVSENFTSHFFKNCYVKINDDFGGVGRIESGKIIFIHFQNKIMPGKEHFIESIDFSATKMEKIEKGAFEKFTSLKTLKFDVNFLTNFPDEIWGSNSAVNFKNLDFSYNKFTNLSSISFTRLQNLVSLDLFENRNINFSAADAIFPIESSNLKILSLRSSYIQALNENCFYYLTNLVELDLSINPLKSVPSALKFLPKLRKLLLQTTDIPTIPKYQFKYNPYLEVLNMMSGDLKTIEDCAFCRLSHLKEIHLNYHSRLSKIHENAFGFFTTSKELLPSLNYFAVNNCNISILSENLINWKYVENLKIYDNPFMCNCSMAWLIDEFNGKNFEDYSSFLNRITRNGVSVTCFNPPALRGSDFIVVFLSGFPNTSRAFCAKNDKSKFENFKFRTSSSIENKKKSFIFL